MSKIPPDKIEEVRQSADVVDIVSEYVTLKRSGQNYFGLCPFHPEKSPSFSVNSSKQIFHCFGCGVGGNVISFIMKIENLSFPEAVLFLAKKVGVNIPLEDEDTEASRQRMALYNVNQFAAEFFHNHLLKTPSAQKARDYIKQRGFSEAVVEKFQIGWSPESWESLIQAARQNGISIEKLKGAGLVLPNRQGGTYDRFRGRLIFPIHSTSGLIVGFGGRILENKPNAPKYMNTPETLIYHKGKILYGLFQNREAIRRADRVVLVEGYADLISLVQFGIENVVASSGTALTENQAETLKRFTKKAVILYDGDLAGAHAALRGADILVKAGLQISVVLLPAGHDPDTYVREFGPEKMQALIDEAQDLIDFKIFAYSSGKSLDTPQNKSELLHQIAGTLVNISDDVLRNLYGQRVASKLGVPENIVFREIAGFKAVKSGGKRESLHVPQSSQKGVRFLAERDLVRIGVEHPEMLSFVFQSLSLEELKYPEFQRIFKVIFQHYQRNEEIVFQEIFDLVEDTEMQAMLAKMSFEREEEISEKDLRIWTEDCLATIKLAELRRQIDEVRQAIRQAQAGGEDLTELSRKYLKLKQAEDKIRLHEFVEKEKDTDDIPF